MRTNTNIDIARQGDPGPAVLPSLPRDADGPVFAEPWQARIFAIIVSLHGRSVFSWSEWSQRLGAEMKKAQAGGDPDLGDSYYDHWLRALKLLVAEKELIGTDELTARRDAWDLAARATPHGEPIVLGPDASAE